MVSALDCRSRGLGTRPGLVNVLCSRAKKFNLTVPPPPPPPGVYMSICELSGKPDEIVEEGETL